MSKRLDRDAMGLLVRLQRLRQQIERQGLPDRFIAQAVRRQAAEIQRLATVLVADLDRLPAAPVYRPPPAEGRRA